MIGCLDYIIAGNFTSLVNDNTTFYANRCKKRFLCFLFFLKKYVFQCFFINQYFLFYKY